MAMVRFFSPSVQRLKEFNSGISYACSRDHHVKKKYA